MRHHEDEAFFIGQLAEVFAMFDFQRERLFDDYVTARIRAPGARVRSAWRREWR